jgi:hypothetical protein
VRSIQLAPGALRRARRWLPIAAGAGLAIALALPGRPVYGSVIRGYGTSWQPVSDVIGADHRRSHRRHRHRPGPHLAFRIGGSVGGLYPGFSTQLVLTVVNSQSYKIVVTSITTRVGAPKAGCSASNLIVGAFTGHLKVKAHKSAQLSVPVTLSHAAPDACQGVVFPLTYSGLGRRA